MRLLTHNMLVCSKKSCNQAGATNFPLRIKASKVDREETEFNKQFTINMLPRLDWKALVLATKDASALFRLFLLLSLICI